MEATGFDAWVLTLAVFLPVVGALVMMVIPLGDSCGVPWPRYSPWNVYQMTRVMYAAVMSATAHPKNNING